MFYKSIYLLFLISFAVNTESNHANDHELTMDYDDEIQKEEEEENAKLSPEEIKQKRRLRFLNQLPIFEKEPGLPLSLGIKASLSYDPETKQIRPDLYFIHERYLFKIFAIGFFVGSMCGLAAKIDFKENASLNFGSGMTVSNDLTKSFFRVTIEIHKDFSKYKEQKCFNEPYTQLARIYETSSCARVSFVGGFIKIVGRSLMPLVGISIKYVFNSSYTKLDSFIDKNNKFTEMKKKYDEERLIQTKEAHANAATVNSINNALNAGANIMNAYSYYKKG